MRGSGENHSAAADSIRNGDGAPHLSGQSRSEAAALYGDHATINADTRWKNGVRVENVRVIAVIGASVAAYIRNSDQEVGRGGDLGIQPRHAGSDLIERRGREGRRSGTWRIGRGPNANHWLGFELSRISGLVESGHSHRQGAVGLGSEGKVSDVPISTQRSHPVASGRYSGGAGPGGLRFRDRSSATGHKNVLLQIVAGSDGHDDRRERS